MRGGVFGAVQELSKILKVDGHVYPASKQALTLNAEFTDGTTLAGEAEITAAGKHIRRVWVTQTYEAPRTVRHRQRSQKLFRPSWMPTWWS